MIHVYDPDMKWWGLQGEGQQLCVINYGDGLEHMILSVDISDLHGEKAVWIFPVPAKPEETVIDIIEKFPRLSGYDVKEKADEMISRAFTAMTLSQVYTFPFVFAPYFAAQVAYLGPGIGEEEEGVAIHEHIEKMGLATELVTAGDAGAFGRYLTDKRLELPYDSKSVLDEYVGQEYSFVVSWVSDVEKFKEATTTIDRHGRTINTVGVFIAFPTDKIYFPLKPTSVYGNRLIPILIYDRSGSILFAISSCLASMFAGSIIFRRDGLSKKRFALLGLWNLLTLIGFIGGSIFLIPKKREPEPEQEPRSQGTLDWQSRKISFAFLFSIFFMIITTVSRAVLQSVS